MTFRRCPARNRSTRDFAVCLAAAAADPAVAAEIRQAAAEAERDEVAPLFEFRNLGRPLPAHWTTLVNGAAFGTDYRTRTAVAASNVFVNRHRETKYYFQDLDLHGRRLEGSREYQVTFPPGALPPAKGFWSLTLYDERHALPLATGGKVAVGSRDSGLRYGADGSLTIIVSREAVATATDGDTSSNRIVAPNGVFSLYLRIYWPDESALDGTWTPPPCTRSPPRCSKPAPEQDRSSLRQTQESRRLRRASGIPSLTLRACMNVPIKAPGVSRGIEPAGYGWAGRDPVAYGVHRESRRSRSGLV